MKRTRKTRADFYKQFPHGGAGLEIGVQYGENAWALWENANPSHLLLVDPWRPMGLPNWEAITEEKHIAAMSQAIDRFPDQILAGQVEFRRGSSSEVLPSLPDDSLHWAYIDGDHRLPAVLFDLRECARLVKDGGVIAGHDYLPAKSNAWARRGQWGIVEAVSQFCRESNWRLVEVAASPEHQISPSFLLRQA
jgi:hypothetical protein